MANYKFNSSFIKKLTKIHDVDFRLLDITDKILDEDIVVGKEGAGSIIRLCEFTTNPLDIYITTKNHYKIYDKHGTLINTIDHVYYTEEDFINYLKVY